MTGAVHVTLVILMANGLLLSFTFFDDRLSAWLSRWLFRSPDYRACLRQFGENIRQLDSESEIAAALEPAARIPMELAEARMQVLDDLPAGACPAGVVDGELVERNFEVWAPIASAGRISHALVASPGPARPALVTHDLN